MLAAVAACVGGPPGRRCVPLPPAPAAGPARRRRPAAAARRPRPGAGARSSPTWPVLEDEWLAVVERRGWRLPPDVLVGLLRRHRTDAARRARVAAHRRAARRRGCVEHQPELAPAAPRPAAARRSTTGCPAWPSRRSCSPCSTAAPDAGRRRRRSAGSRDGAFGARPPRRARQLRRPRAAPTRCAPLAAALGAPDDAAVHGRRRWPTRSPSSPRRAHRRCSRSSTG